MQVKCKIRKRDVPTYLTFFVFSQKVAAYNRILGAAEHTKRDGVALASRRFATLRPFSVCSALDTISRSAFVYGLIANLLMFLLVHQRTMLLAPTQAQ